MDIQIGTGAMILSGSGVQGTIPYTQTVAVTFDGAELDQYVFGAGLQLQSGAATVISD